MRYLFLSSITSPSFLIILSSWQDKQVLSQSCSELSQFNCTSEPVIPEDYFLMLCRLVKYFLTRANELCHWWFEISPKRYTTWKQDWMDLNCWNISQVSYRFMRTAKVQMSSCVATNVTWPNREQWVKKMPGTWQRTMGMSTFWSICTWAFPSSVCQEGSACIVCQSRCRKMSG